MKGQALITLIFFSIIAMTVTTAAVLIIAVNSISGTKFQQSEVAYQTAQSGAENGLVRVLRDPANYTGETLTVGSGSAEITKSGSGTSADPYIILSKGQVGNFTRQVQISATYINNQMTVISQKEIF